VLLCFVPSFPMEIKRRFDTQQLFICNTEHVQQNCNVLLQPLSWLPGGILTSQSFLSSISNLTTKLLSIKNLELNMIASELY
jgi:hypothetical protein